MFGKKQKGVSIAGDPFVKIERCVRDYKGVSNFQKDVKKMAKDGWYVKSQITKHDTGVGILLGVKHEIILVTYERVVKKR
jgi:hypothetical protein